MSTVIVPVGGFARLTAIAVGVPQTVVFDAVIARPGGELVPWQGSVNLVTAYQAVTVDLALVPGEIISSRAATAGGANTSGYTAARMDVYAGDPALEVRVSTVVHGVLCLGQLEGLPLRAPDPGLARAPTPVWLVLTAPAAGAGFAYTFVGWQARRLHAVRWKLVNDGNVAVRTVFLITQPIAGRDVSIDSAISSTAGQTSYGAFVAGIATGSLVPLRACDPLPLMPLSGTGALGIYVHNIQVGDQLSELVLVADFDWLI